MSVAEKKQAAVRPNHNFEPGPLTCCQVCGSTRLELVVDLGHQPLCDTLLSKEELQQPEMTYPLRQVWCRDCTLSQLDYVVPGNVVYHADYPYRSGITRELAEYQVQLAKDVVQDLAVPAGSLVVDMGSNDGTLLSGFKSVGMNVQGVEPTNISKIANQAGIPTIQSPFTVEIAKKIVAEKGQAKVVTATNVFAHMASLGEVISGLEVLVADDGHFVLENHYLSAIMDRLQFDTIYHEHLRSYSLRSLITLFDFYDFTVVDAMEVTRYGGNIRLYVAKGKGHTPKASVAELLAKEEAKGFYDPECYVRFREQSIKLKDDLLRFILDCKAQGKTIVGNSCPGRCSTLLNFAGIGPDLLPYLAEQPTSLKLGKYLPGMHIPVVNNQLLIDEQPDYVLLLAWHYAEPIAQQLRARGLKSKLVVPMPELKVLDI